MIVSQLCVPFRSQEEPVLAEKRSCRPDGWKASEAGDYKRFFGRAITIKCDFEAQEAN